MKRLLLSAILIGAVLATSYCFGTGFVTPPPYAGGQREVVPEVLKQPKKDKFVDALTFGGRVAIMSDTECIFDGKPAVWGDIPDEGTELVEIHIDVARRVVLKIVYRTVKEI